MQERSVVEAERGQQRGGFTLIEVLVAVSLFATAVTFFSMAYLNTLVAMERTRLNQGLEQDLSTIRRQVLQIADLDTLEKGGTVVTGEHGVSRWSVELEPTQVADLFAVELSVELEPEDDELEEREVLETLYLTRPSWSDPVQREELRARSGDRLYENQTRAWQ